MGGCARPGPDEAWSPLSGDERAELDRHPGPLVVSDESNHIVHVDGAAAEAARLGRRGPHRAPAHHHHPAGPPRRPHRRVRPLPADAEPGDHRAPDRGVGPPSY
ncbi:MAG: hypothetical protein WKG07_12120, partial [Hymenobacter sp.]